VFLHIAIYSICGIITSEIREVLMNNLYVPVTESPEVTKMKRCERNIELLGKGIIVCLLLSASASFGFMLTVDYMLWLK